MPSNLPGVSPQGAFHAQTNQGQLVEARQAVFPIIKQSASGHHTVLGTGFFIGANGLFATARHVLADEIDECFRERTALAVVHFVGAGNFYVRTIGAITFLDAEDVAVGTLQESVHRVTKEPLRNKAVTLTGSIPAVGDPVTTFAFPECRIETGEREVLHAAPDYFAGVVQEHHLQGRDRVLLPFPCIRTSIHIHAGASGGPVFDRSGRVWAINIKSYDGATDLSYVTPVSRTLDLHLNNINIPNRPAAPITVRELAERGFVNFRA